MIPRSHLPIGRDISWVGALHGLWPRIIGDVPITKPLDQYLVPNCVLHRPLLQPAPSKYPHCQSGSAGEQPDRTKERAVSSQRTHGPSLSQQPFHSRGHFETIETRSVSEDIRSFSRASLTLRVTESAGRPVLKCPLTTSLHVLATDIINRITTTSPR